MLKRLLRHPAVQGMLGNLIARYLTFALKSTSWTVIGEQYAAPHIAGRQAIVAFWHERLPLVTALWLRAHAASGATAHALISRHSDGRLLGAVMRRLSVNVVHGSTARDGKDRGGSAAIRALLQALQDGGHVVITPDGPRGPRRVAAAGVAQLAALSGVPVLPCAAQASRRHVLPTWDRMVVPLPWGRGVLVCRPPITVARDDWEAALPAIAAALTEAADDADRACA